MTRRAIHIVGASDYGGGVAVILGVCRGTAALGWESDVLTSNPGVVKAISEQGIGVVDLPLVGRRVRPLRDVADFWRLYRFLRRNPYDLVHTHTSKAGFIGRAAARLAGVPAIVHTVHGFAFHDLTAPATRRMYVLLERAAARWCDAIVTVSEYHRTQALTEGIAPADKVVAIPNGIDPGGVVPTRTDVRAELGLDADLPVALAFGRMAPQKGLEYLLKAAALRRNRSNAVVLIAGDGAIRLDLEALARELEIVDVVRFLGFRLDMADLIRASDYVVLPSLWEGMSIALLEAMAAGKAIITTDIPSNLEVEGGEGSLLLVPAQSADALAAAMDRLENDEAERERLGSAAQARFRKCFTIDDMAEEYGRLYQSLLRL